MLGWMSYEITGHKTGLEGAFIRTQAHTASDALRFAREWAEQGVIGITIVSPKGESFDIDGFGMIVSTNEGRLDADRTSQRALAFTAGPVVPLKVKERGTPTNDA